MEKKTKTPEGNQNKNPQNQIWVHKTGISFKHNMGVTREMLW